MEKGIHYVVQEIPSSQDEEDILRTIVRLDQQSFKEKRGKEFYHQTLHYTGGLIGAWNISPTGETVLLGYTSWHHPGVYKEDHIPYQTVLISSLAVVPEYRCMGIGNALIKSVLDLAYPYSVILQVREENSTAQRLYTKNGFKIVSRLPDYYGKGEHGFLMINTNTK